MTTQNHNLEVIQVYVGVVRNIEYSFTNFLVYKCKILIECAPELVEQRLMLKS